jgi:hypothetical protein
MPSTPPTTKIFRPQRLRVKNEQGAWRSLSAGREAFTLLAAPTQAPDVTGEPCVLFLGLGPEPEHARQLVPPNARAFYLEAPDFLAQTPDSWTAPTGWTRVSSEADLLALLPGARIYSYALNLKLFPSFWAPLLGLIRAAAFGQSPPDPALNPMVLLPGSERGLLLRELEHGLTAAGARVRVWDPDGETPFERVVAETRPSLFFSVNFQGLDPYGERFHLLRRTGAAVAVWCVDNPWHLLQGVKSAYWTELELFVTDASFIPSLEAHGGQRVRHLPLALWDEHFSGASVIKDPSPPLLFVGRSEFPNKKGFFAGQSLDPNLRREAQALLAAGERPDFAWWTRRLGLERLWPDAGVRAAGFGAEESSRLWRADCLRAASRLGLRVYGDEGWRAEFVDMGRGAGQGAPASSFELLAPVDYYGVLRDLYASARYTLNVTSLLLPAGLTQRHFDVWGAGGFLLTDATPGLSLFPQELTEPITFRAPTGERGLDATLRRLESDPTLGAELRAAWRSLLRAEHSYAKRVTSMLELVLPKRPRHPTIQALK